MEALINPDNLKIARERLNFSLEDAAKKLSITDPNNLELAEQGKRNMALLRFVESKKMLIII